MAEKQDDSLNESGDIEEIKKTCCKLIAINMAAC